MKAEQLITLLQGHLGEDITIVTQEYDSDGTYGEGLYCTYDITGIEKGNLVIKCLSSRPIYECPPTPESFEDNEPDDFYYEELAREMEYYRELEASVEAYEQHAIDEYNKMVESL